MSAICLDILGLGSKIQVNLVKQRIQGQTVGSGDMSHGRAMAIYDHLDHRIVIFKYKRDARWLEMCAFVGTKSMLSDIPLSAMSDFVFLSLLCVGSLPAGGCNTSISVSHKLSAGISFSIRPASNETISVPMLLLASPADRHEYVLLPKMHHICFLTLSWSLPSHPQSQRPGKDQTSILMQCFPSFRTQKHHECSDRIVAFKTSSGQ